MFQAIYTSQAQDRLDDKEFKRIAEHAEIYNTKNDITGLLLVFKGQIIQILEGDEGRVRNLLSRIEHDDRHKDFLLVLDRQGQSRQFGQWSLFFKLVRSPMETVYFELIQRQLKHVSPHAEHMVLQALTKSYRAL